MLSKYENNIKTIKTINAINFLNFCLQHKYEVPSQNSKDCFFLNLQNVLICSKDLLFYIVKSLLPKTSPILLVSKACLCF